MITFNEIHITKRLFVLASFCICLLFLVGCIPTPEYKDNCSECPMLMPQRPNWCEEGTIIPGATDECGCVGAPRCILSNENREGMNRVNASK